MDGEEPVRRFLALQLPSTSAELSSEFNRPIRHTRRFSAVELNAGELARRLMEGSCDTKQKRRSYECSVFEIVDLGPVSRGSSSTNSLGPAAVHRVSIRRKRPGSSRSSRKSAKSAQNALVQPKKGHRWYSFCPCFGGRCEEQPEKCIPTTVLNPMETASIHSYHSTTPNGSHNVLKAAKRRISQFFESIAPQEEFKDEDALLEYLYSRSHKMQPKDGPKPPEVKSKHGPHVLKSPGIKPPKGNHYSRDHPTHNLPPTTPSPLDDGSRASPSHSGIARSSGEDFAIIHITPGQQPRHIADVARRQHANGANFPLGPVPTAKKSAAPPPLHPRKLRPEGDLKSPSVMAPLLRQTGTASPPHPHRSPRLNHHAQAFIFPEPTPAAPQRLKPPAPPPVPASTSSEHRVTLPTTSPRGGDGDSACVSVSLPPPQLPPRLSRPGSSSTPPPVPPPRPPKPGHLSTSPLATPKSAIPQKTPPAVEGQSEGPSPPPLPPKTYKTRRQSSSPTN